MDPLPPSSHQRGAKGEAQAADHLRSLGFDILVRNYRWRRGEIDLICREGDTLCFVEVRYRSTSTHGFAIETISAEKRRRVVRAAEHFLTFTWRNSRVACRFDVIAIDGDHMTLHRDAFRIE